MSASAASSSNSASVSSLLSQLDEHAVALGASVHDAHAALAIVLHLHTLAARPGTKLVALSEDDTSNEKALPTIPPRWSSSPDGFCFQYHVPPSASAGETRPRVLLVKMIRMDRALLVHACLKDPSANGASKNMQSLELRVDDHVNEIVAGRDIDFQTLFKALPSLLALYEHQILDKVTPKPLIDTSTFSSNPHNNQPHTQPMSRQPVQQQRPEPDQPIGFDPLRVYPRGGQGGQFGSDLDPIAVGGGPGGNLMGPGNFPFGGPGSMGGIPGGRGSGAPGMAPRFDPYGPVPGMGEPDFDEFAPPGPGGPSPLAIGGPRRPLGALGQQPPNLGGPNLGGPRGFGGGMAGGPFGGGFGGPRFM